MNFAMSAADAPLSTPGREECHGTDVPAVALSGVSFAYDRSGPVLDNISLSVQPGDFLALIGPNGGGKTTLFRLLLGLHPPQNGSIAIFGNVPAAMSRHIGYVPQFSTVQPDFPASVLDMVLMGAACPGPRGGGWDKSGAAREKAGAYLELLGLGGALKHNVSALSGGQRQRALVARALMGSVEPLDPSSLSGSHPARFLLLLDEPTASIDPEGKFCFYEFLGQLRGRITIIVVSHDLFMVSPFFSSVLFVNRTVTPLGADGLSTENLSLLFGQHLHDCPVADMQHARGSVHHNECTHPACRAPEVESSSSILRASRDDTACKEIVTSSGKTA